jgi:hypothetical protein
VRLHGVQDAINAASNTAIIEAGLSIEEVWLARIRPDTQLSRRNEQEDMTHHATTCARQA